MSSIIYRFIRRYFTKKGGKAWVYYTIGIFAYRMLKRLFYRPIPIPEFQNAKVGDKFVIEVVPKNKSRKKSGKSTKKS